MKIRIMGFALILFLSTACSTVKMNLNKDFGKEPIKYKIIKRPGYYLKPAIVIGDFEVINDKQFGPEIVKLNSRIKKKYLIKKIKIVEEKRTLPIQYQLVDKNSQKKWNIIIIDKTIYTSKYESGSKLIEKKEAFILEISVKDIQGNEYLKGIVKQSDTYDVEEDCYNPKYSGSAKLVNGIKVVIDDIYHEMVYFKKLVPKKIKKYILNDLPKFVPCMSI